MENILKAIGMSDYDVFVYGYIYGKWIKNKRRAFEINSYDLEADKITVSDFLSAVERLSRYSVDFEDGVRELSGYIISSEIYRYINPRTGLKCATFRIFDVTKISIKSFDEIWK